MIKKIYCLRCGATKNLVIHHKNFDHYDNVLSNLEVLCNPCHSRLHLLITKANGKMNGKSRASSLRHHIAT